MGCFVEIFIGTYYCLFSVCEAEMRLYAFICVYMREFSSFYMLIYSEIRLLSVHTLFLSRVLSKYL